MFFGFIDVNSWVSFLSGLYQSPWRIMANKFAPTSKGEFLLKTKQLN